MVINHPEAESFPTRINNKLPLTLDFYLMHDTPRHEQILLEDKTEGRGINSSAQFR